MIKDQSGILISERRSAALNKTGVSFGQHVYLQEWLKDPIPPTRYYDDEHYRAKNKGKEAAITSALDTTTLPGLVINTAKMGIIYSVASALLVVVGSSFLATTAVKKVNKSVMSLF